MKKKTIAILLVLVIGMVGVFANDGEPDGSTPVTTDASVKLTTTVAQIFETKLVESPITSPTRTSIAGTSSLIKKPVVSGANTVGTLYIVTNHAPGYVLSISGDNLKSSGTGISTEIKYILSATNNSDSAILDLINPVTEEDNANTTATYSSSTISGLTITPYTVSVNVDSVTYDAAQAADYTADVTFTFTAT